MSYQLTTGALETIMQGGNVPEPVMQILGSKKMGGGASADRYRLLVSDGKFLNSFAMLATQLNEKILSGELSDFTVIRINRLITSIVNNAGKGNKRVMIILDVSVLASGSEVGIRLGNPMPYDDQPIPASSGAGASSSEGISSTPPPAVKRPPPLASGNFESPSKRHMTSNGDMSATHPIASLNPYQNRWTIKARITSKSPVKTWSNARGEGKLFSMDLIDESGEIRCTAFKEAVDKFYEMLEVGKVYYISGCTLKTANKQYTHIKHDYEMTVNHNTIIEPCHEDVAAIPSITFDFTPLERIQTLDDKTVCDVIGVSRAAGNVTMITSRTSGKEFTKREVTLVDESGTAVSLTLWGTQASEFDCQDAPVMALKGAMVREFQGVKSISCMTSSVMQVNPDIPQAHRLRGWYENVGVNQEFKVATGTGAGGSVGGATPWVTFRQMKMRQLGCDDKPAYINVKATIITTKHERALYQACPNDGCNKKVIEQGNGMYRCEKCNREYDSFQYRLLTVFNLGDYTTNNFVQSFQDTAELILGISAQELGELEKQDPERYQEVFNQANFKSFVFKLRVKMETYNDTSRLKATVFQAQKVDYKTYNAHLISEIKRLHHIGKVEN